MSHRSYVPKVGSKVKLHKWEHYRLIDQALIDHDQRVQRAYNEISAALRVGELTEVQAKELEEKTVAELRRQHAEYEKTHDLPCMWAWFEVLVAQEPGSSITPALIKLRHIARAVNAPDPAWEGWVDIEWIEVPLGWKPVYEIVCKDKEQADKVVSEWFKTGVHVWQSRDLGGAGHLAFTPFGAAQAKPDGSDPASPHWQYGKEPLESVEADLCPTLFVVSWIEEWEPPLPEGKAARKKALDALRSDPDVRLEYIKAERFWLARREHVVHRSR
jgi:hypothetical protein